MRYTFKQFMAEYPDDDACLQAVWDNRYGDLKACPKCGVSNPKYYRVRGRTAYQCKDCRLQLYPLVGTIFFKSSTSLHSWFYAIYLFSVSKNGVSAKELERSVEVSYKTAHRMEKQIRKLMADDDNEKLGGSGNPVQADESYVGGRRRQTRAYDNKKPVLGLLEKGGKVKTRVVDYATAKTAMDFIQANVEVGSLIHTDESKIYTRVQTFYTHESIRHGAGKWAVDGVTTNHLEGFWGQLKRSLNGTYHAVSPRYLGSYIDEFAFRYNNRSQLIFPILLAEAVKPF